MSADGIGIKEAERESLSPFWRYGVLIVFLIGFGVLIWITAGAYKLAPPIPDLVVGPDGSTVFTGNDIRSGQEVFLKNGLMDNGTLWGHGAYLRARFFGDLPSQPGCHHHHLAGTTGCGDWRRSFGGRYQGGADPLAE